MRGEVGRGGPGVATDELTRLAAAVERHVVNAGRRGLEMWHPEMQWLPAITLTLLGTGVGVTLLPLRAVAEPFEHGGVVAAVAYAPDGKTVASAGDDRTVRLWDVATGKEVRSFTGHQDGFAFRSVAFAPDG